MSDAESPRTVAPTIGDRVLYTIFVIGAVLTTTAVIAIAIDSGAVAPILGVMMLASLILAGKYGNKLPPSEAIMILFVVLAIGAAYYALAVWMDEHRLHPIAIAVSTLCGIVAAAAVWARVKSSVRAP